MVEKAGLSNMHVVRPHVRRPAATTPAATPMGPTSAASASLSVQAREMSQALEAVRRAPDIRTERIAALKERVLAGTYRVPEALLAQKMLDVRA
jgi:flagellar biosynthesis anti-sigma factor FlgM